MIDEGPKTSGQKVMLASTAYDSPDASYTFAIQQSREALTEAGIGSAYILLTGNCHVDDARNSVVHAFMQTDCTDLVFLDADVSWRKQDLVMLCQHQYMDIVGGVYPYKKDDSRGMPYMPLDNAVVKEDGLLEVVGLPTGFMRIHRSVLEKMITECPKFANFQKNITDIPLLFERTMIDGVRYGGDINFCLKWREAGGQIYADTEAVLGHAVKTVVTDSLGAYLRRRDHESLPRVAKLIQGRAETFDDYTEAVQYVDNKWGISAEGLFVLVSAVRSAQPGPVIEAGSGLSTIIMAAATDDMVWCIEHNPHFANETIIMARQCGLENIAMISCDIHDGWYAISPADKIQMPEHFAFGFNDGPPRYLADRTRFLDEYGDRCDLILCDDADDADYVATLTSWAGSKDRRISFPAERSAIIMKAA